MKFLYCIVLVVVCFYVLVRYLEKTSIFYPDKTVELTPDRFGLPYEEVDLTAEDGAKLNGWFIKRPSSKSVMLFLHGNAGNIGDRLTKIKLFYELGLSVFIIDYRGFGRSEGVPSEKGVYRDGRAAFDYLQARKDLQKVPIVLYGESLGGAVAIDLATHRQPDGLIVDSTFPSAAAMSRKMYPMIPTFFLAVKFDSESKAKSLTLPKLFMHSTDDAIVPFAMGERLFNAAAEPKHMVRMIGGHNDAHVENYDNFVGSIKDFLVKNGWL